MGGKRANLRNTSKARGGKQARIARGRCGPEGVRGTSSCQMLLHRPIEITAFMSSCAIPKTCDIGCGPATS